MTWLLTIARNSAIDRLRKVRSGAAAPLDDAPDVADPAPDALHVTQSHQDSRLLRDCLAALDSIDHRFITAAFLEGSTYAVLAERALLPLGTVKSRIRRALLKLRECLQ